MNLGSCCTNVYMVLLVYCSWDEDLYKDWIVGVDEACSFNLNQPLITRNEETKLITVNFDPQLVAVLREVKYLEQRGEEKVPDSAAAIYTRYDTLWKFVTNLDTTVKLYNNVRTCVLEVEFPLIEGQVAEIDNKLKQAESTLNWNSDGNRLLIFYQQFQYQWNLKSSFLTIFCNHTDV